MPTLVTGATGHVGRHLVPALLKHGDKVRCLVRSGSPRLWNNIEYVEGDLSSKESLKKAVAGCDVIYHLAALVSYTASKDELWRVNVEGTKNLLEAAQGKKFVYLSSTGVHGKKLTKLPADESEPYRPTDYYGRTKMEAEKAVLAAGGIALRATDIYGPGFTEGYDIVFKKISEGKMMVIGDGKNRLQYLHVDDLVSALVAAKQHGKPGQAYIIAGSDVRTQEELYGLVAKQMKVAPPAKHVSLRLSLMLMRVQSLKHRLAGGKMKLLPAHIEKLAADRIWDISKAERELNWNPRIRYTEGIGEMVVDYLKRVK
jgi:nucleoside-diphosphate-sugar epimerase